MKVYKKLFSYVPNQLYFGWVAILFSVVSVCLTVWGYQVIYQFLEMLIVQKQVNIVETYALKTVILLTIGAFLYVFSGIFSHVLGFRLETNLRKKGIEGLTQASFRFFDLNSSGLIRKTIDDNAAKTHVSVAHLIPDSAQAVLTPILVIVLGFFISIRLGIILLLMLFLGLFLFKKMMGNNNFIKDYQNALATLSSETVEYVRGIQVIKIFGAKVTSFKALYQAIQDYSKYAYEYSLSGKKPFVWFQWLFFSVVAVAILPVIILLDKVAAPEMMAVELMMLLFLSGVMFVSFMRVMYVSMYLFEANYAVENLEILYKEMQQDQLTYGKETTFSSYQIDLEDVSFSYREDNVLTDFSLTFEEGKSYALVGSSGSGKSTIAKLISGFYQVDKGTIKIGNKKITDYTKEAIIETIAFVFQDSQLFSKSIYENVALANPKASRQEVLEALKLAGCNPILDKFEDRENTVIGSQGVYLSGGEKQRLAIARAMLKNSKIVIMDEASASIDPDNEYELQKAFQYLMREKTVIMIAHRLSSIKTVDKIIVLEDGQVIEEGTHDELIEQGKTYKELVEQYEGANEWRFNNEAVL
ncbi:ABC transporter ATP-binding protein [Vagococcus carniphilus]|uniref:ABC transporter ATP-binding protein n=1 Tax=Vagococcus carniphilus TaxID=218144 RepID=UPI00289285BD|nr:ABC transporter ATP-binding protein [Vagococcus carniphilus]MDT2831974.1 ABC transporter ATP-binding protein [Vagococcus carniphilus]MDT2840820.1 ABC transporter ATP-binding protein [Vagococcus carniphilus]MDT2855484.1 ABC transporter ATP-binding protein [Vagococcus carniphilus]